MTCGRLVAVVLSACVSVGCQKPKASAPPPSPTDEATTPAPAAPPALTVEERRWQWEVTSSNGRTRVTQRPASAQTCTVSSEGATKEWESDECLGESRHLHFVSNDGDSVITVEPLPASDGWKYATVAWLAVRGTPTKRSTLGSFLATTEATKAFQSHLAWLQGTHELPGTKPQYALDEKAVELTTVEGRLIRLSFDGSDWPEPQLAPKPAKLGKAAGCTGMIRWKNARGQVSYTDSLANVPKRFRKSAQCTQGAEIAVVDGAPMALDQGGSSGITEETDGTPVAKPPKRTNYCVFSYATYEKSTREITNVAPSSFRERSFCAGGSLADAQRECETMARGLRDATPCRCTDDPGTRCH